jgi:Leucine-rich repeat (LRR) protein
MAAITRRIIFFFSIFAFFLLFPGCTNKGDNQSGTLESYPQSDGTMSGAISSNTELEPYPQSDDSTISGAISNPENEDVVEYDTAQLAPEPEKPVTKYYSSWKDIPDVGFLSEMKDLEQVTIRGSRLLTDISPLASLYRLKRLNLSFCPNIQSIAPLSNLVNLEYLLIDYEKPTDCAELQNLTRLKELHLNVTPITSVEYIARLTELEKLTLFIPDESVDISQLGQLTKLNELILEGLFGRQTKVDLDGFQHLVNLERLELCGFIDLDLHPLTDLPQLKYLDFDGSTLLDMMQLVDFKALAFFCLPLNYNDFSNVAPILKSAGVTWGPKHDR